MLRGSGALDTAISYLPTDIAVIIEERVREMRIDARSVSEIRLRCPGTSALTLSGENVFLPIRLNVDNMREIFKKICDGAVFAHRDDVCRGFVTLSGGIRVGVCGYARYDGGRVVGIGEISALVFRLPGQECSFGRALCERWRSIGGGMLICSRAGEGKTTAIRALAGLIGSGDTPMRVVVADERCEFQPDRYADAHVDILRGYRRPLGIDIAIRTMSAEVLIVDEISSPEDSHAMLSALGAGVSVIATVHAASLLDAMRRPYVRELIDGGLFESVCVIRRDGRRFGFEIEKIEVGRGKC